MSLQSDQIGGCGKDRRQARPPQSILALRQIPCAIGLSTVPSWRLWRGFMVPSQTNETGVQPLFAGVYPLSGPLEQSGIFIAVSR